MAHPTYYLEGKKVPSVTTVLGKFKDPSGLTFWANKCAYEPLEEAVHHIQKLCTLPSQTPQISKSRISAGRQFLRSQPLERGKHFNELKKAATAGTLAHKLVEEWLQHVKFGSFPNVNFALRSFAQQRKCTLDVAKKALTSYSAFLSWITQTQFHIEETELQLVSEKYGFGGTLDCNGWIGDSLILLDWKTSKRVYIDYILQVAAYSILWNEHYDPAITEAHIILFHKETGDFQHHQISKLTKPKEAFLKLLDVYNIYQDIKKGM